MNYEQLLLVKAAAELELRTRKGSRQETMRAASPADFAAGTMIEVPTDDAAVMVPFHLWDAQTDVFNRLLSNRLVVILKARQLGISWLVCLYALWRCVLWPGQRVLALSRGLAESRELIRRVNVLYHAHRHVTDVFPELAKDNLGDLVWKNGSSIRSAAATRDAGKSYTASMVILDEWAFMPFPQETLQSVKPAIDGGGQLVMVSSGDGPGTEYHQFWQSAETGSNGYHAIFLPWTARPDRTPAWRDSKLLEANGDMAVIAREYPASALEAFTAASGLVYDVWNELDGVTDAADYIKDAGPIYWAIDDGYSAGSRQGSRGLDPQTNAYVADAHPRVILFIQQRPTGQLAVFAESYACMVLSDVHITAAQALGHPDPIYASHGPGSAEIRGRLQAAGLYTRQCTANVDESIKETRRWLAADDQGQRRIIVHPRCKHLRQELLQYRWSSDGKPVKAFDHGPDALRGLVWTLRYE